MTLLDSLGDALAEANATDYGLAAFVFTHDLNSALRFPEEFEYGTVCVIDWLPATPEAPFGSVKQAAWAGKAAVRGCTNI